MLIWSLFVVIYFGLQTILLQNMYQNPQSAAQVADGTSKHYRKLFSPEKKSKVKATLQCSWLVLYLKKMNVFFKILHCMFSQFSRVIFDTSFSQDNMKNLPNKIGPENFLYFIVSERSSSLWWRNDILSRTDFSYLFLFFLLSSFFFHTDKNDYYHEQLTSSGIHMNEQE